MRSVITLIALIISSLSLQAQSSWGVKAGKLFNNFYSSSKFLNSQSNINAFNLGLYYTKPINSKLNLEWSLLFENKTTSIHSPINGFATGNYPATNKEFQYKYISLDIMSYTPISKNEKLRLGLGGYMSYVVGNSVLLSGDKELFFNYTNSPGARKYDVGALVALDYKINNKFSVFLKVNIGLANLMEDAYTGPAQNRFSTYFNPYAAHNIDGVTHYYRNIGVTFGVKYQLSKPKKQKKFRTITPNF